MKRSLNHWTPAAAHKIDRSFLSFKVLCAATIILFFAAIQSRAADRPPIERQLLFALSPEFITPQRTVREDWVKNLAPTRDAAAPAVKIEPLRLPAAIAGHPILGRVFRLTVPEGEEVGLMFDRLRAAPGVQWCESEPERQTDLLYDKPFESNAPPADPLYPQQWYLNRINAPAAWDVTLGDTSVIIAVVDVGVDLDHGDLSEQLWVNWMEKNGQPDEDDDGNGFVDDIYGWDFYSDDADPRPNGRDAHGTHVAGIACAQRDNGYGIAGLAGRTKLMAVRTGFETSIVYGYEGLIYAAVAGADIVNLSWGGDRPSNLERIVADWAADQGVLVIAAAGNRRGAATFDHYPAGYSSVIAVAATDSGDFIPAFSNYAGWVDVCAPGAEIISTIPGGFGLLRGTSMATPLVAGAAGLIKALNPTWRADELRLQVTLTADPIDALNPHAAGRTGFGRLNVYRALMEVRAGVSLDELRLSDENGGNNDGIIQPAERLELIVTISNRLRRSVSPVARVESADNLLLIEPMNAAFGLIEPGESADNNEQPLLIGIAPNTPTGGTIEYQVIIEGEGLRSQRFAYELVVEPPYATHQGGAISLTVSNFGAIGYFDYPRETGVGESFRYPKNGLPMLYHGGLMLGAWPGYVSDVSFGDSTLRRVDFRSLQDGMRIVRTEDGEVSRARFNDSRANNPLNVNVEQTCISYYSGDAQNAVVISYNVANRGMVSLDSLYIGMFLDWDVVSADRNLCGYDYDRQVGWVQYGYGSSPVCGVALISRQVSYHVALPRDRFPGRSWTDEAKWEQLRSGFAFADGDNLDDYWQLIGTGPLSVQPNDSLDIAFILTASDDLEGLFRTVSAVRNGYRPLPAGDRLAAPGEFQLLGLYPQPFNNQTRLTLYSYHPQQISWRIYDLLGRSTGVNGRLDAPAGWVSFSMNADQLTAGVYWVRLTSGGFSQVQRAVIVK